jgi:uncharacterized protein YjlB
MPQPGLDLTPLSDLEVKKHFIPPCPVWNIPNSSASDKPLLIYRQALTFPGHSKYGSVADEIERHLGTINTVSPQWRYGMNRTSHFHSTTHEVLCVSARGARLLFGGEANQARVEVAVERGDVIVVPAGVAHRSVKEVGGFEMVGAYPVGAEQWDMCYSRERLEEEEEEERVRRKKKEEERVRRIRELGWFKRDPVYGEAGPVLEV